MLCVATLPVPASLVAVLSLFSACFTAPTFRTFCALVAGLVAQTGRRTICGMIVGAGLSGLVRHERFRRFFPAAVWCPGELGLTMARLVIDHLLPPGAGVVVLIDDTLLKRWGKKVFGVFWTHDGAAQGTTKLGRGNRWVVAAIAVCLPFTTVPVGIPVLCRLWRGKDTATPTELARDMAQVLHAAFPGLRIHCVGDAAYHSPVLKDLPGGVSWMCRLPKNAVLQGPAPPRTGRRGAPRKRGDRLGTCTEIAATAAFAAHRLAVCGQTATVSIAQVTGQWYTVFKTTPVRIILVRDDTARDRLPYHLGLVTTDTGAGQARNRVRAAAERTFPFQLIVYGIVIAWYVMHAYSDSDVRQRRRLCPWYRTKTAPSYEDMLTKLRLALAEARFSAITPRQPPTHENPVALVTLSAAAA